jgi:hypothetical protein
MDEKLDAHRRAGITHRQRRAECPKIERLRKKMLDPNKQKT